MKNISSDLKSEVRFAFGENWRKYLKALDDKKIKHVEESIQSILGTFNFSNAGFLDVGNGSGIVSLAARRLGAKVKSFDYDPDSIACANYLKQKYFPNDSHWTIEKGSILDEHYCNSIGKWDIVYSWGVLHHTGDMWRALENTSNLVKPRGTLFIAIYNYQPILTPIWKKIKYLYNISPFIFKYFLLLLSVIYLWAPRTILDILRGKPFYTWRNWGRGMSPWHDVVDWVGGYPFEASSPEKIINFMSKRDFFLKRLKTSGGKLGCNEYLFVRSTNS